MAAAVDEDPDDARLLYEMVGKLLTAALPSDTIAFVVDLARERGKRGR